MVLVRLVIRGEIKDWGIKENKYFYTRSQESEGMT